MSRVLFFLLIFHILTGCTDNSSEIDELKKEIAELKNEGHEAITDDTNNESELEAIDNEDNSEMKDDGSFIYLAGYKLPKKAPKCGEIDAYEGTPPSPFSGLAKSCNPMKGTITTLKIFIDDDMRYYVWYDFNGNIEKLIPYLNGKLHGEELNFHNNGVISRERHHENGKSVGRWAQYGERGKEMWECFDYVDGQKVSCMDK